MKSLIQEEKADPLIELKVESMIINMIKKINPISKLNNKGMSAIRNMHDLYPNKQYTLIILRTRYFSMRYMEGIWMTWVKGGIAANKVKHVRFCCRLHTSRNPFGSCFVI